MKCAYHPTIDAVGACVNCGRLICAECKVELGGKIYCNPCTEKLVAETTVADRAKGLNCFERHLNWTEALSWIAWILFVYIVTESPILSSIIDSIYSVNPYISKESVEALILSLAFIITLAWLLPINAWILKKKKKSLWNLLWVFTGFILGWVLGSL